MHRVVLWAVLAHPVVEYLRSHKGPKISFGKDQHFNRVCINEKLKSGEIFNCDVYDVNQNILQSTKI